jgi:hypothetical protein
VHNVGNIHLLNTDFYLHPTESKTNHINQYMDAYNNQNWNHHQKYDGSIHQHYKILDCYNLFKNDNIDLIDSDYIVRLRLDVEIHQNILDVLSRFNANPELEIVLDWDLFALGKPDIMKCYCNGLNNKYGTYNYNISVPDVLPVMPDYKHRDKHRWTFAPERQLFEMLYEYCNKNSLDINRSIENIKFCGIVRS